MAHQYTYEQLHERTDEASQKIELGARYRHNKTGGEYVASEFVTIEATEELAVVYRSAIDEEIAFVRTIDNFVELVEIEGKQLPRFVKID